MSNLVIPVGGIGTQADGSALFPTIVQKTVWDAGSPSDFMGTNGGFLYSDTSGTLEAQYGGTNLTILGDFSNAVVGMYAWISLTGSYSGYFEILSKSATSLVVGVTNLAGEVVNNTFMVDALYIGGAGSSITVADNVIANDIDVDVHSVDVLTNLNETLSADTELFADSGTGKIRFLGKRHAASYEFADCQNKSQYPVIDGDYAITFSGDGVEVSDIKFSLNRGFTSIITMSGKNSILDHNWILATNSTTYHAVTLNGAIAINNYIDCPAHSMASAVYCALSLYNYASAYGNFITCDGRGMLLRVASARICFASNNIIINPYQLVSDTIGITTTGLSGNGGLFCTNNIVAGFTKGINLDSLALIDRNLIFYNNIIWGQGTGSYGIYDNVSNVPGGVALHNNFIGNCETNHNLSYDLDFHGLTANPFKNASGNLNVPSDFYLNDTEGGGALIKANYQPTDYDLDGTRDNYQYGVIMEEATSGGGGGVSASRIFGGL